MAPRRARLVIVFRALALIAALATGAQAVAQGLGASTFWAPCFALGYDSDACMYLQYRAPAPDWFALFAWWPAQVALAIAVVIVGAVARARFALAVPALGSVALANVLFDYSFTPMVNGGYVSADDPPGFGLVGAVLFATASALFAVSAALPARAQSGARESASAVQPDTPAIGTSTASNPSPNSVAVYATPGCTSAPATTVTRGA